MEVDWVDEEEWEAIEKAMAAAVQQRDTKLSKTGTNDVTGNCHLDRQETEAMASENPSLLSLPTLTKQGTFTSNALSGAQPCSFKGGGSETLRATGVATHLGVPLLQASGTAEWGPGDRHLSSAVVQLSSASAPSGNCSYVDHQSDGSSQQVFSLSDWVPSQQDFPGFWPERPTAGGQQANPRVRNQDLQDGQHRAPEQKSERPETARSTETQVRATSNDLSGVLPSRPRFEIDIGTVPSISAQGSEDAEPPQSSAAPHPPHEKPCETRKERQLPAWLTSAKPPQECTLPSMRFGGRIVYAVSPPEVDCCARMLLEELRGTGTCLGFDIEWKVTFRRGEAPQKAALIQLCASAACCYLLHIAHSGMTSALRALLEEESIGKAGAGIYGDAQKLRRDFGVSMGGLRDLSDLANERLQSKDAPKKWSLTALAQEAMLLQVEKPPKQRISDWEKLPLSPDQRHYAATDAYASLRLYQVLMSLPAPPPRPILRPLPLSELNSQGRPVDSSGVETVPELWVPAATEAAYLAPSKMGVLRMHLEGLAIEQIAEKKGVRVTTVEGYLIEAIQGGMAYSWHRMGVSEAVRKRVEEAVRAEMESATALEDGGSEAESRASKKGLGETGLIGKGKEEGNGPASPQLIGQTPSGSGFRNGSTDGKSARGAKEEQASGDSNGLAVRSAAGFTKDGLAGLRLKVVMERIPLDESISFSQLRMVVAHLARLVDVDTRQQKRMKLVASCHQRQSDG